MKRALITGYTGQDGSYLAELLVEKGYQVFGLVRRRATPSIQNVAHLAGRVTTISGDLTDQASLLAAVERSQPDEVYNLAAQSFVGASWAAPEATAQVTALGAMRLLEAVRRLRPEARCKETGKASWSFFSPCGSLRALDADGGPVILVVVMKARIASALLVLFLCPGARSRTEERVWNPEQASKYLDERQTAWFAFDSRGEGATRSTCVSCHTVLPYALARPALRQLAGGQAPTEQETKLLAQTRMRVRNWRQLDTDAFGLFYDDSEQKKQQSWGTEAVFNAVILAFNDRYQGRSTPSEATRQALANLWATQVRDGDRAGSWDWLDFSEPPWGSKESRYFGAALAAVAVGTAPGYYSPGAHADSDANVDLLREYLKRELPRQNLHGRAWGLWAAAKVEGILSHDEQKQLIGELLDKQRDDGGWSLPSLGTWVRSDGTAQELASDGYATGLVLHVLQTAAVPKSDKPLAQGLDWLKSHQLATGAWRCVSITKERDPASEPGKFMSDAATALAVLALSH